MESNLRFVDVHVHSERKQDYTISYRTGLAVYEEGLRAGRYVSLGWNGAGYLSAVITRPTIPCLVPDKFAEPQAFHAVLGGQELRSHWTWQGMEQQPGATGLHVAVKLTHAVRPVQLTVHTRLDGTPILSRWLEIENLDDGWAALSAVHPWSGGLQSTARWRDRIKPNETLYSLGYMEDTHWGNEGDFRWHPLPNATYGISGRYLRDRFRHPMFVLRNHATGEHFIGQLAWSGGYSFIFDVNADSSGQDDGAVHLSFKAGPDSPAPLRMIAPKEVVRTPEMHLGMLFGGLDDCVQAMHTHIRRSVFIAPQAHGHGGWVESGLGPEMTMDEVTVRHQIEIAASWGAEVFFIDAGWYTPPGHESDWYARAGDWHVDTNRYPGGIDPIRNLVREKGMLFGLWMEAERIGQSTQIFQAHPEWLATDYEGRPTNVLDLGQSEVAQWVGSEIARVIDQYHLDFFRLDYNVGHLQGGGVTLREGYLENNYWRYYETFDRIFSDLRKRFPDVIFETCASGGGRTDLGTVKHFSHTWVTDWQVAPRSFRITNGMTMALPPEFIDRLIAGQSGHVAGDIDFQARQLLFARPTLGHFHPAGSQPNVLQMERVRHMVQIYKEFVRPFGRDSRIFHHSPELPGTDPTGWGVLELSAADKTRGIVGIFQLGNPSSPERVVKLRGVDASKKYRITWDNSATVTEIGGYALMQQGIVVRLEAALTSELLLWEECG